MSLRSTLQPARAVAAPPSSPRWLGASIDDAARDGQTSIVARAVMAGATAAVFVANTSLRIGMLWLAVYLATEAWGWQVTRRQVACRPGTPRLRLLYLVAVAAMTMNWSAVSIFYWSTGEAGLRVAAIVAIAAQLIHAQAFTFRSVPVLLVNAGIPAALLVALPLGFGGFHGLEQLTVGFALAMSLAYSAASARANYLAARRLTDAHVDLEKLAYRDSLTMLGNRRLFAENLRRSIAFSSRHGTRFALLMIDLDHFKAINDRLGHAAGDVLLVEVGLRLQRAVRAGDHVARTGGDEFAILLAGTPDADAVEATCQRIADSFADAIELDGTPVRASVSVGVALYPDDGRRHDSLMHCADAALYDAKRSGRATWRYWATMLHGDEVAAAG